MNLKDRAIEALDEAYLREIGRLYDGFGNTVASASHKDVGLGEGAQAFRAGKQMALKILEIAKTITQEE